jgi:hypothetical protein
VIITTSTAWRDHLAKGLTDRTQRRNQHRAQLESERAVLIENAKEGAAHTRVCNVVLRVLSGTDGLPTAELRRKISGRDRGYVDPALAALTASGHVVAEPTDRGTRYRLATP